MVFDLPFAAHAVLVHWAQQSAPSLPGALPSPWPSWKSVLLRKAVTLQVSNAGMDTVEQRATGASNNANPATTMVGGIAHCHRR